MLSASYDKAQRSDGAPPQVVNSWTYDFPVGKTLIIEQDNAICGLHFVSRLEAEGRKFDAVECETPLIARAAEQLREYFAGQRREFDLPLSLQGTAFQQACWQALLAIPYGETRSYKQQAELIGNPKACRAVGLANNRNPVSIIVPCHRVVGHGGSLVGYGGGLEVKRALLELEFNA